MHVLPPTSFGTAGWLAGFPAKSVPNQGGFHDGAGAIRRYENVSAMWARVAAASALLLIGFILVASWNSNIASSGSSQPTTASRTATPPSTEGSGSSSPKPFGD